MSSLVTVPIRTFAESRSTGCAVVFSEGSALLPEVESPSADTVAVANLLTFRVEAAGEILSHPNVVDQFVICSSTAVTFENVSLS